jgi:hypothetical protein
MSSPCRRSGQDWTEYYQQSLGKLEAGTGKRASPPLARALILLRRACKHAKFCRGPTVSSDAGLATHFNLLVKFCGPDRRPRKG